jgi:hypothetical protein
MTPVIAAVVELALELANSVFGIVRDAQASDAEKIARISALKAVGVPAARRAVESAP